MIDPKTPPMKIVLLASGDGSNAQVVIDQVQNNTLAVDIKAIISNRPDAHVLQRAQNAGIAHHCLDHKQYETREEFDGALLKCVAATGAELVVLLGFMRILSSVFTKPLKGKIINLHPSLLPKYPGLKPHKQAFAAGDTHHGATVHFVNEVLDGGPIIIQGAIDISNEPSEDTVRERVRIEIEHKIVPIAIQWLAEKRLVWHGKHGKQVQLDNTPLSAGGYLYQQ